MAEVYALLMVLLVALFYSDHDRRPTTGLTTHDERQHSALSIRHSYLLVAATAGGVRRRAGLRASRPVRDRRSAAAGRVSALVAHPIIGRTTNDERRRAVLSSLVFAPAAGAVEAARAETSRATGALLRRRAAAVAVPAGAVCALRAFYRPGLRAATALLLGRAGIVGAGARSVDRRANAPEHLPRAHARFGYGGAAPGWAAAAVRVRADRCAIGAAWQHRLAAPRANRLAGRGHGSFRHVGVSAADWAGCPGCAGVHPADAAALGAVDRSRKRGADRVGRQRG